MAVLIVDTLADTVDAADGLTSLREALAAAKAAAGADTIRFTAGGQITLASANLIVDSDVLIQGDIDGNGTADVVIDGGAAVRSVSLGSSPATALTATLSGLTLQNAGLSVGASATLSISSAALATGALPTGALSFASGAKFAVNLDSDTAFDQARAIGAVTLGGATLNVTLASGYAASGGRTFVLIDNDGSDAVTGTFGGLVEGAVFYAGASAFRITYKGGDGNDVVLIQYQNIIVGDETDNVLTGTAGVDRIDGLGGDDSLSGGEGRDLLRGGTGDDVLSGAAADDRLAGGAGNDEMDGGAGSDFVDYRNETGDVVLKLDGANEALATIGGTEVDRIRNIEKMAGGSGDDVLSGDGFVNYLIGFTGDDRLKGGGGIDLLDGGEDRDTVDYGDEIGAVKVQLNGAAAVNVLLAGVRVDQIRNIEDVIGGSGADALYGDALSNALEGGPGADVLRGNGGNDRLSGGDAADVLQGGDGDDMLDGGLGADKLGGGAGADTLDGGAGGDSLSGEAGADTFVFSRFGGTDGVRDFQSEDTLAFRAASFGLTGLPGDPAPVQFGAAATGAAATFLYNAATKTVFFDSDGAGGAAAERLAILTTTDTVTAADFILI